MQERPACGLCLTCVEVVFLAYVEVVRVPRAEVSCLAYGGAKRTGTDACGLCLAYVEVVPPLRNFVSFVCVKRTIIDLPEPRVHPTVMVRVQSTMIGW